MSYIRVIPRDLFNEANLLKCLGRLWIALDEAKCGHKAQFVTEDVPMFDIRQNPDDGSTYVANIEFRIGGEKFTLYRPLNSREAWPLYTMREGDWDFEPVAVFNDDGSLSDEMLDLISAEEV